MLKNNENRKIIQFQFPRIPFPSFTHLFSRKKQYFPFHDNQVKSSKALLPAPLQQQQLINFQFILTHPLKHTHTVSWCVVATCRKTSAAASKCINKHEATAAAACGENMEKELWLYLEGIAFWKKGTRRFLGNVEVTIFLEILNFCIEMLLFSALVSTINTYFVQFDLVELRDWKWDHNCHQEHERQSVLIARQLQCYWVIQGFITSASRPSVVCTINSFIHEFPFSSNPGPASQSELIVEL